MKSSKVILGCILSILVALTGCASVPPHTPYPLDQSFQQAEKDFLEGNYQSALANYDIFIKISPTSPYCGEARYRMGLCYLALGDYDKARETLLLAQKETPYPYLKSAILSTIGKVHLFKREYSQAAGYYKKALAITGNELPQDEILFNLATALIRSGQWEEGRDYFLELTRKYPNSFLAEAAKERLFLPPGTFIVQLGRYREKENAEIELEELRNEKGIEASLKIMLIEGERLYITLSGQFSSWEEAFKRAEEIQAKGVDAIVVP